MLKYLPRKAIAHVLVTIGTCIMINHHDLLNTVHKATIMMVLQRSLVSVTVILPVQCCGSRPLHCVNETLGVMIFPAGKQSAIQTLVPWDALDP